MQVNDNFLNEKRIELLEDKIEELQDELDTVREEKDDYKEYIRDVVKFGTESIVKFQDFVNHLEITFPDSDIILVENLETLKKDNLELKEKLEKQELQMKLFKGEARETRYHFGRALELLEELDPHMKRLKNEWTKKYNEEKNNE